MSYNVMVIPEDYRKDRYILEPILEALVRSVGKAMVKVKACPRPNLGGVAQALREDRLREIINLYRHSVHCFILVVDRDGKQGRRTQLDQLEVALGPELPPGKLFLAENAWQEVEVWLLAGHDLLKGWNWSEIRRDENPKERFYEPLARARGVWNDHPDQGRQVLAREAAKRYDRIRQRCPEDVARLEARLEELQAATG